MVLIFVVIGFVGAEKTEQEIAQELKELGEENESLCSAAWTGNLEKVKFQLKVKNIEKVINNPNSRGNYIYIYIFFSFHYFLLNANINEVILCTVSRIGLSPLCSR